MSAQTNVYLEVKLGTDDVADISSQVTSVDIQDEDRGTDRATVILDDQSQTNTDAIREGNEVRISLGWESEHSLMFIGRVHSVRSIARSNGASGMSFICHDISTVMNVVPPVEGRQHVGTLEDILTAIAGRYNVEMGEVLIDPMPSFQENDPRGNQGTKTTWAWIQDLAEEHRSRAYVEVNTQESDSPEQRAAGGVARLYFISEEAMLNQEPLGKMRFCRGFGSLLEFDFQRVGSGAAPSAQSTMIDPVTGEVCTESGPEHAADEPATLTGAQTRELSSGANGSAARSAEGAIDHANAQPVQPEALRPRSQVTGRPSDCDLSRRQVMQDPTRKVGLFGRGLSMGATSIRAKGSVEIDGLAAAADGRWYLRRVNHIVQQSQTDDNTRKTYRTRFEATR